MMGAKTLVCTVPAASKAKAVEGACTGDISIDCPASIMRTHDDCVLFCDPDSGKYLARQA
jgi:glucosamine-6-phosphate deaminase